MSRSAARKSPAPAPADESDGRLVPAGVLLALALPFLVFSTASSAALRESKLLAQAVGSVLVLFGLALSGSWGFGRAAGPARAARLALVALAAAGVLALASAVANARTVDPLGLAAVLSPLALLAAGASRAGGRIAPLAATAVCLAAALSGLLAAGQRWIGVLRLPLQAPEPRFFAAGLVGNPGDLAMALVVPAVLLFATAADVLRPPHLRLLAAASLGAVLLGLAATEAVAPALAFGAGALLYVLLAPRRRAVALAALLAVAAVAALAGGGRRVREKLEQVRRGDVARATTQRDIGLLAAAEMVRARPLLGVGPGAFPNAFVSARIAAEERTGRRLVHLSESAHFDNAHSEPVTLAAECGLPAAAAAALAFAVLLAGLLGARHGPGSEANPTTDALLASLAAIAVLSLGGFPLRLPVASGPVAFLAGLAFRRAAPAPPHGESPAPPVQIALAAAAVVLLGLTAARSAAVSALAEGEGLVRAAAAVPDAAGPERAELLSAARERLRLALTLRPRDATALLALGSVSWLERDVEKAHELYARSAALEERAETDLNLGRVALQRGRAEEAAAWFRRALWILPRLKDALPPAADPARVAADVDAAAAALPAGGRAPAFPAAR
jgi:O-antigen ligase